MSTARTSTGGFTLGLRRNRSAWQGDPVALARWARENRLGFVDLGREAASADLATFAQSGLQAGSVDLLDREGYAAMIGPDSPARRATIAAATQHIEACAVAGVSIFLAVTIPMDPDLPRRQNFAYLVESFAALEPVLERNSARLAIEGWPGPGAVCCTPETFRACFREIGSDRFGVNYDPSHLVRMGIDPLRFLEEFGDRVLHVHAKDTAISDEALYDHGHEMPAVFEEPRRWSGATWRYTIPGRGRTDWPRALRRLRERGFGGLVSIELEDLDFHGTAESEQRGLLAARDFLEAC